MANPYGTSWRAYYEMGWYPLWLPYGQKSPPPEGYTGKRGEIPSAKTLQEWEAKGIGNIGLRLDGVVGLDIDGYKPDVAKAFRQLVEANGPLPETLKSSARDDHLSGIYLFQCARDIYWPGELAPGIEIIQHDHRYMVAPPSVHPDGGTYRWNTSLLPPDYLPMIPSSWIVSLDKQTTWETGALTDGEICTFGLEKLARYSDELRNVKGSRHDKLARLTEDLCRVGCEHNGGIKLIEAFRKVWLDFIGDARKNSPESASREYDRLIAGALSGFDSVPELHCQGEHCGLARSVVGLVSTPLSPSERLWRRPNNAIIKQVAEERYMNPYALLVACLARVAAEVHYRIVLEGPPSIAPLNLYCLLTGQPGQNKSATIAISRQMVPTHVSHWQGPGSGEGLAQHYVKLTKEGLIRDKYSLGLTFDESDMLTALSSRQGSTLTSALKTAWTGAPLGNLNADPSRNRHVDAMTYRLCILATAVPSKAKVLLQGERDGLLQRFIVMPAWVEGTPIRIENKRDITPLQWDRPIADGEPGGEPQGWLMVRAEPSVRNIIEEIRLREAVWQEGDKREYNEGHTAQQALRLAAIMAIMNNDGLTITLDYFQDARLLMLKSQETTNILKREAQREAKEVAVARRLGELEVETIVEDDRLEKDIKTIINIIHKIKDEDGYAAANKIRSRLRQGGPRDRAYDTLGEAIQRGLIERIDASNAGAKYRVIDTS